MRASHLVLSLLGTGVLGCGGNSQPVLLDAPPAPLPDAFACAQRGTLNATSVLDFSTGGGHATGAVRPGGTALTVAAVVTNGPLPTTGTGSGLVIIQVNNAGVFGAAATAAGPFEKPPAPGTYPMDTDMNLGFGIDFVDGISANPGGGVNINATQVAVLDSTAGGTVKIDSWTPLATPGGTTTIGATFTNAKFKGFNAGDQTPNGCDITLTNFAFKNLSVQWQATPFPTSFAPPAPAPRNFGPQTLDGAAVLQVDHLQIDP